ncbi:hypothetical protein Pmar_PMAR014544 [Perkinsus marinus ATCC 50983]|uniref:Uncharacterized protein n=1 Tax=Perkinsus marinus (strain ATCC 50983 / TXsc) TaxID=423536 RepID=C5KWD2_PERM5|nr:hypothetical protein Pmar_PMAR014544 [Perkinsus marinus ATCC 50983]EER11243.1 hypothetical protein Pmar_PMAR014544 [Perkinsus marinus ATCC 50983]|eukprot:XP_002779448.1 hypothetical protein Pmar_PMAR014544 [Perkinsus marinus ATCC 50983]
MLSLSGISFAAANTKADSFRFLHGGFSAIMTVCWLVIAVALCHWSITFYKLRLDRGEITLVPSRDRYAQDLVDDLFNSFTRSYSEGECRDGGYDKATKMFIRPYCKEFQTFRELIRLAREPETVQHLEEWEYCMSDTPSLSQAIVFVLLAASTVVSLIGGGNSSTTDDGDEERERLIQAIAFVKNSCDFRLQTQQTIGVIVCRINPQVEVLNPEESDHVCSKTDAQTFD